MPQITDIRPQKKQRTSKPRFNIYIDGQFSFALPAETLLKSGLKINQTLSPEEIEKLVKENEFGKVYDRVLKFLSYRPRSGKEILDWFKKKQVGEETQKLVSRKLKHLGYLNDEEFTRWWIEQRTTFRPAGFRLLAMELRQKGIPKEIIDNLKPGIENLASEKELAKKAAEKKMRICKNLPPLEFRQKMTAFLARRGFSWEIIEEVVDPAKRG